MALKEKYQELLTAARAAGVTDLSIKEHRGMLFIEGTAPSEEVKQKLWDLYGQIADYRTGELMMKILVDGDGRENGHRLS